ncbi:MAG TPA: helix-turn-helix transcriptional regulator [Dermatophilaceae bacterium]
MQAPLVVAATFALAIDPKPPTLCHQRHWPRRLGKEEGTREVDREHGVPVVVGHLGHSPLLHAIEDLATRARIDLAAKEPSPSVAAPFGLTARELAVLRLLGQGRTNAQVGTELFISTKTASVHVSNILRKMQVPTRVAAATVAAQIGLLEDTGN